VCKDDAESDSGSWDLHEEETNNEDPDEDEDVHPEISRDDLRSFEVTLDAAILELGGAVAPKLEDKVPQVVVFPLVNNLVV